jgi:hypothetical protein
MAIFGLVVPTAAQEPTPEFKNLRYEENYEYLADPRRRTTFWESIKYIPLNFVPSSYLSLGGEIRERYEYTRNPVWGEDPQDKRGAFLQRYNVYADLHLGNHIRLFGQLNSALAEQGAPAGQARLMTAP